MKLLVNKKELASEWTVFQFYSRKCSIFLANACGAMQILEYHSHSGITFLYI